MNNLNIRYVTDYPYSVAFGGKEIQSIQYQQYLSQQLDVKMLDYYRLDELSNTDIIHFFGHSLQYYNLATHIRAKNKRIKMVVSPTFYTTKELTYIFCGKFFTKLPVPNLFSVLFKFFELVDLILVNSEEEKKQIVKIFGAKESKVSVIYNAIENLPAPPSEIESFQLLSTVGITGQYVLNVGFFDSRKNTLNLLRAFEKICNQVTFQLVLLGQKRFSTRIEDAEFDRLVSKLKGKVLVTATERMSPLMLALYKNSDFFVLPSKLETPGISTIEALSFGKTALVGDCPPVREYFGNKVFYCNGNDVNELANAMLNTYSAKRLDSNELKLFQQTSLSLDVITDQLKGFYSALIG